MARTRHSAAAPPDWGLGLGLGLDGRQLHMRAALLVPIVLEPLVRRRVLTLEGGLRRRLGRLV
eukprot:scaffold81841_cov46-Phaeocystis_antarctica.AAC.4